MTQLKFFLWFLWGSEDEDPPPSISTQLYVGEGENKWIQPVRNNAYRKHGSETPFAQGLPRKLRQKLIGSGNIVEREKIENRAYPTSCTRLAKSRNSYRHQMFGTDFKLLLLFTVHTVTARKPRFVPAVLTIEIFSSINRTPVGIRFRFDIQNPTIKPEIRSRNNYVIAVGSQIRLIDIVLFYTQNWYVIFKHRIRFEVWV